MLFLGAVLAGPESMHAGVIVVVVEEDLGVVDQALETCGFQVASRSPGNPLRLKKHANYCHRSPDVWPTRQSSPQDDSAPLATIMSHGSRLLCTSLPSALLPKMLPSTTSSPRRCKRRGKDSVGCSTHVER